MNVGIIGFRGSGKTTVFNALTGLKAEVGGYHGGDVKNLGAIKVPDPRLKAIAEVIKPKRLTYAEIRFTDLAAATPAEGKGFSAQALADMRQSDALVHVVRGFDSPELASPADPGRDVESFESELILADLIVVENRLERLKKQGDKGSERGWLEQVKSHLESDLPLRTLALSDDTWGRLAGFGFLSRKPCMVLLNVSEERLGEAIPEGLSAFFEANRLRAVTVSGQVEMEVNDLEEAEALDYLSAVGLSEPAKNRFIREVYDMLHLMSFFTFGPEEVRAWTIRQGTRAQQAAGKIHSDMERGFIRAEVMAWEDVVHYGSEARLKEAGKMRLEGKEYKPRDGECVHFRFNV